MSRFRGWCFTINNYNDEDLAKVDAISCEYCVAGLEVGESGTPHVQGYVYFGTLKSLKQMKKIHAKAHWEGARGDAEENRAYCIKEGRFKERGTIPHAGKRTDIDAIKDAVKKGATMSEVVENVTSYQALKTAETLMKYQKCNSIREVEVKWYWGPSGSGKTWAAIHECGDGDYWISSRGLKWWDGYSGQKYVIIDDFRRDFCTFHELLRLLDIYPFRVETKGSSQWLRATTIVVTAPYDPVKSWEGQTEECLDQLRRRIKIVRQFLPRS